MKTKQSTEYVLLGSLMDGPKHGYEIIGFLNVFLKPTWHVSTSQLYALLKRLEKEQVLSSGMQIQDTRPSKRVYELTNKGKGVFLDWLHSPVQHMRDFRIQLIAKLFFFHHLSLDGAVQLIDDQVEVLKQIIKHVQQRKKREPNSFTRLIFGYKLQTVHGALNWLQREAIPFMRSQENEVTSVSTEK